MSLRPCPDEDASQVRTKITSWNARGLLDLINTLRWDAVVVPARNRALVDAKLPSQVDWAQSPVFKKGDEIDVHYKLVAQLSTKVNADG